MNRREFVRMALASGLLYSSAALPRLAAGSGFPPVPHRVLAKLMLPGGPDMRHIIVPPFNASPRSFGYNYWQARARAQGIADSAAAWEQRWHDDYTPYSFDSTEFGIHNDCGWLQQMWAAGNVAIVSNVYGGKTRNHAHCVDVIDQGVQGFSPNQRYGAGWGGRLADFAGGAVTSLTRSPRSFCYGPADENESGYSTGNIVSAANFRAMSLYESAAGELPLSERAAITRSVQSYYAAKGQEMNPQSIYRRFVAIEQTLRELGEPIDARLQAMPLPAGIQALMDGGLNYLPFAQQIANIHDVFATFDILSPRVISMDFAAGWDTHSGQRETLEPLFQDLFGLGKSLNVMFNALPSHAVSDLVLVIAGEFGRQLRDNGDNGTDHGEGNCMFVIGAAVTGGLYGELFPEGEIGRLRDASAQIDGLTSLEQLFGEVCDWAAPGAGDAVFPQRRHTPLEADGLFSKLFAD